MIVRWFLEFQNEERKQEVRPKLPLLYPSSLEGSEATLRIRQLSSDNSEASEAFGGVRYFRRRPRRLSSVWSEASDAFGGVRYSYRPLQLSSE